MADFLIPIYPDGSIEAITTSGTNSVISLDEYLTKVTTSTASDVATVPDGTKIGQVKKIFVTTKTGSGDTLTLTADNSNFTNIVFDSVGDRVTLMWVNSDTDDQKQYWRVLEYDSLLSTGLTPVITP